MFLPGPFLLRFVDEEKFLKLKKALDAVQVALFGENEHINNFSRPIFFGSGKFALKEMRQLHRLVDNMCIEMCGLQQPCHDYNESLEQRLGYEKLDKMRDSVCVALGGIPKCSTYFSNPLDE